jgi:hypothetical protein
MVDFFKISLKVLCSTNQSRYIIPPIIRTYCVIVQILSVLRCGLLLAWAKFESVCYFLLLHPIWWRLSDQNFLFNLRGNLTGNTCKCEKLAYVFFNLQDVTVPVISTESMLSLLLCTLAVTRSGWMDAFVSNVLYRTKEECSELRVAPINFTG